MSTTLTRFTNFFAPQPETSPVPLVTVAPSKIVATLMAPERIRRELTGAQAALEKARAAYDVASADLDSATGRVQKLQWSQVSAESESRQARNEIFRASPASADENREHELGLAAQRKAGSLRAKHSCFASVVADPAQSDEAKELAKLQVEITECKSHIARNHAAQPGNTAWERRLPRLLAKADALQPQIDRQRKQYDAWLEVQAANREAEAHFAERDRLRKEREDAAIAAVLKSPK